MVASTLYVSCLGLVCAVGLTPESASAAMRSGIAGFSDLPYVDNNGAPVVGAIVPALPNDLRGRERLIELFKLCVEGFDQRLPSDIDRQYLPLLVCTREPDLPGPHAASIVVEVEARLGFRFCRERSGHVPRGAVAGFEALRQARHILAESDSTACLVIAVDSLVDARALQRLDRTMRLKTPVRSDGIIPGEAACLMLVAVRPLTPWPVTLGGLGFAAEHATVLSDEPLFGKGMTAAVREALSEAGLSLHEIDFRLSDVAGESYAFEELVLAQSRLMRQTRQSQDLWHPAAFIGDCGAAAGLIQLAWAEQAFAKGYAPGPIALAHGATAAGDRAAAVICAGDR
jgi:3-oxoacyl-[acyl-carrier-protein] synthase I